MNYNLIYEQAKDLLDDYKKYKLNKKIKKYDEEAFKSEMENNYIYLYKNARSIFSLCLTGKMDLQILYYMINQAKNIYNETITSEDASIKVGEKLLEIIKPKIDKNK